MPSIAAALLVGLLPTQSLAVPPDPDPSHEETGRESVQLEPLDSEEPVAGTTFSRDLETLEQEEPAPQLEPPSGITPPPADVTASVNFGATATPASLRADTADEPIGMLPAGSLPVSLGQAPGEPEPTGTWQVVISSRTSAEGQGVDGAVVKVEAPAAGAVPVSIKLDYSEFESLYGADWASRLRFVQFPDCYLVTPGEEACQAYEELETANDVDANSITATVDPAADDAVTPASAPAAKPGSSGVIQASYRRTSTSATPVAASSSTAVVGAVDSGAGKSGDFKASPLASDGKWEAGGSAGAFAWSYPLTIPPPPAGPAPVISFDYNSQSVDGRTATSSPQASWIGEGWTYDPGYIERRYRSCKDDTKTLDAGTPNNTAKSDKTSDLCWVSYNAVMSLNGKSTELVRDASAGSDPETDTELYRPLKDDGTRVQHKVGATNGDNNGEYWLVTTKDGTKYYLGLNEVGGGHADTGSVSTVPVFGNHPAEPCHSGTFANSRCGAGKQQAWRWGLDKVVDVHGNTMIVNWKQETNHYAVRKTFKTPEKYDRYAYPTSIEYGMRSDLSTPSAKVEFGVSQRCIDDSPTVCDSANFAKTDDPGAYRKWWDTPGNLNCKSDSDMCPAFPSFWTQLRLTTVTTKAARADQSGLGEVDTYTLNQSFPKDWYDTAPGLWLNSITRTGFAPGDTVGTKQSAAGVSFAPYTVGTDSPLRARLKDRQLPNLVLNGKNDQRPGFTRPRIGTVSTENGGDIEVEYTGGCADEPAEDKGKNNGTCFPVRWSPDGDEKTPAKAWFNKYVVDTVTETDKITSHGRPITTRYKYEDSAWAKSDDEFTRPALRTYSDWKGYRTVTVLKGAKSTSEIVGVRAANSQSKTVTRYFQGTGGAVKDSTGTYTLLADDAEQFAGMTAETVTYENSSGDILKRNLSFPYSKQTASRARENEDGTAATPLLAHRVGVKRTDDIQTVGSSWRSVRTLTAVDDTYGLPTEVETSVVKPSGGSEVLSDRTCTTTAYVHNTSAWLIGLPKDQRSTATSCAGQPTADPATELKTQVHNTYDGLSDNATPVKGLITAQATNDGDGNASAVVITTTYDPLGRVRTVTAPEVGTSETQYTPADTGGPVTQVKTINTKGQASTTTYDPGRGLALAVTDPNGRVTRTEYDALGRLVKGWSPSAPAGSPTVQIAYQMAVATPDINRPAAVTVQTLKDDGSYARQITLYDGLQREVQTQSEAHGAGRIIVDTHYDDRGLVAEKSGAYLAKSEPSTDLFAPRSKSLIPSSVKYTYDGLERELRADTYYGNVRKYTATKTYEDTSVIVDPAGSTAPRTRTDVDALGRVSSIRYYSQDASPSDTGRDTAYKYDARGNRSEVTDTAGNVWSYVHDSRGRVVSSTDPDTGTTEMRYDKADRLVHTKDARQQETFTEYDPLGRVRYVRHGSATASPAKEYTYDTAPGGIGRLKESVRHTAGGDYVNRVTGYDAEYNVTGTETVIPANSMTTGLSGTYAYDYTYTLSGKPQSVTLPSVGGLAREKVVTRYNGDGLVESTSGATWYTTDATYSPYGEVLRTVSGAQPYRVWTTNFVDPHTGRLQRTVTDRETAGPHRITDGYYSYDVSGTITSTSRHLADTGAGTWDTQCFTYDVMGELVNAWTSNITPDGNSTGCKAANGTTWGYDTGYAASSGPVADAPDSAADTATPDAALVSSLAAAAPSPGTVSTGAIAYRQSFTFDWIGNRATLTEHDPSDPTKNVTYTYGHGKTVSGGTKTQPHTMTSVASTPTGKSSSYIYDDAGNTTDRDLSTTSQDLVWSPEGKPDSVTSAGVKTTYVYDADGNRILENSPSGSVLYLGETELTTNAAGSITKASRSYGQAGAPTVVRTTTNGATSGHKLNVLLADHLGTANTTVEMSGTQTVTRRAFKPYGEIRGTKPTSWPDKRSYLGVGIDDATTGLTHIGAREYDQANGRFISADPIIDVADPLQMNGYAYANNGPVSKSDPTGLILDAESGGTAACTKAGGCVRDVIIDSPETDWQLEGSTQRDFNGDGYISIFPTVNVPADWERARTYINAFYQKLDSLCTYGIDRCADLSQPAYASSVNGSKGAGCQAVDRKCPAGLNWGQGAAMANAFGMAAAGGEGPGIFAGIGGTRPKSSNCNKCFLAGTKVLLADKSSKNIEDIKVGDEVLATDPETGETGARTVTRLIVTEHDKHFNELTIKTPDGPRKLTATHEHPFWVPGLGQWVAAQDLGVGATLRTDDGATVSILANRAYDEYARTYNLTVEGLHTYYVLAGQTPVLVHNSNCRTASKYEDTTEPKARMKNVRTDVGPTEFGENLEANGWTRLERGPNIEYQKDGARYFLRSKAKTVEGWTADYYRPGSKKADIKIRLGDD
ncbi:polymorphic toxin-type HINT domain-containing protein [Streptomyces antibioticus]|uniref:polymorphic toxin-type HINT domain-containing protein n=1 Tax=Streptomyces antibioticus TaxID=1890 RepID=UPI00367F4242